MDYSLHFQNTLLGGRALAKEYGFGTVSWMGPEGCGSWPTEGAVPGV